MEKSKVWSRFGSARRALVLTLCASMVAAGPVPVGAQTIASSVEATHGERARAGQVSIEDCLKDGWAKKKESIDLTPYGVTVSELNDILFKLHYSEPEYYWPRRYVQCDTNPATGKVTNYHPWYTDYVGTPFDRNEELEREWEIVEMLTRNCETDIEKALVVHDHLVRTIVYSEELGLYDSRNVVGAILEKKCVCEGYALAFKYYMNRLGVPCNVVVGYSRSTQHAWNQIKIDGKWYLVDATWDDVGDSDHTVSHQYFLKSQDEFLKDHKWKLEDYEPCTDKTYDNVPWAAMSRKMAAHKGSLIVPGYFHGQGGLKTGIWKVDARNLTAPATLAVDVPDQWQLGPREKGIGLTEISYYEGSLYYNTPKAVWRWDFSMPAKPEKVFELPKDDPQQIWYLHVADGKVYYETARYQNDQREQREFVFDKEFKKVKQPIAVTNDVVSVSLPGNPNGDYLQGAAPGALTFESLNPDVCELKQSVPGMTYLLIPKKAGEATIKISAAGTDHYLPGEKNVTIVVSGAGQLEEKVSVTYGAGDNGSLTAAEASTNAPVPSGSQVRRNAEIRYTATPAPGYAVKNWIVNGAVYKERGEIYTGTTLNRVAAGPAEHVQIEFTRKAVPLQGIALNTTALSLEKGQSESLVVTYNPGDTTDKKEVTWSSSSDAVATVDVNGCITARAVGETTVTATSVVGGYTAKCTVRVTDSTPVPQPQPEPQPQPQPQPEPQPQPQPQPEPQPQPQPQPQPEPEPQPAPQPQVDKSLLQRAVAEARLLEPSDYKTMSWHPLAEALEHAVAVLDDAKAEQGQVDAALRALESARAALKEIENVAFIDVDGSTSHGDDARWLAANGISRGWENGDGTLAFRPYATVRRADMAAFLYRLAGEPEFNAGEAPAFVDVNEATPHRDAILWLAAKGISTGFEGPGGLAEFRPYAEVTRCDMAAFLYRMAGASSPEAQAVFADVDSSTPHRNAISWLAGKGVSAGWNEANGSKTFRPYQEIARCDMAAFLHRMADADLVNPDLVD